MGFKTEGQIDVKVMEAYVCEPRFPAKENEVNERNEWVQVYGDVCLFLQDKDGNTDVWHGELSNRMGKGNAAHLYRTDMTLQNLQEIGFNVQSLQDLGMQFVAGSDGTVTIPNLAGFEATVLTEQREFDKRDGTKGTAIQIKYLNAKGGKQKRLTMAEVQARFGFGGPQQPAVPPRGAAPLQVQPQPTPAAGSPAPNPAPQGTPVAPPRQPVQPMYYQPQGQPQNPVQPACPY